MREFVIAVSSLTQGLHPFPSIPSSFSLATIIPQNLKLLSGKMPSGIRVLVTGSDTVPGCPSVMSSGPPNLPTPRPPEKTTLTFPMMLRHMQCHVSKPSAYSLGAGSPDSSNHGYTKMRQFTSFVRTRVRPTDASPSLQGGQPLHPISRPV